MVLMLQPRVVSMDGAAKSGEYGWCSSLRARSEPRLARRPPPPQAPTRFTVPSMQLGPDTLNISPAWVLNPTSMAGRIIPLPEGQTVDLIPAPEVDRRVREN